MKTRNAFFAGMAVVLSFYGCADLVDVEEHNPEAGDCLSCHGNKIILEKLIPEAEGSSAEGG